MVPAELDCQSAFIFQGDRSRWQTKLHSERGAYMEPI